MQPELIAEYYWLIEKWDNSKIRVKPQNAEYIQNLIASGEGFIKTADMTLNIKDIKSFDKSDIGYTEQHLLEEGAAQAFKEPLHLQREYGNYVEDVVATKWVKKVVPRRKWDSFYTFSPAYRLLSEADNAVIVMFKVPTHLINYQSVTELTPTEIHENNL